MIIMSVIGAVAIIIIQSIRFGKRIKKQMQPVLDAIGQIKDQNLEYETSCSGIKEFDDCLSAIDDMRDALRESLEKDVYKRQYLYRYSILGSNIDTYSQKELIDTLLYVPQKGFFFAGTIRENRIQLPGSRRGK